MRVCKKTPNPAHPVHFLPNRVVWDVTLAVNTVVKKYMTTHPAHFLRNKVSSVLTLSISALLKKSK